MTVVVLPSACHFHSHHSASHKDRQVPRPHTVSLSRTVSSSTSRAGCRNSVHQTTFLLLRSYRSFSSDLQCLHRSLRFWRLFTSRYKVHGEAAPQLIGCCTVFWTRTVGKYHWSLVKIVRICIKEGTAVHNCLAIPEGQLSDGNQVAPSMLAHLFCTTRSGIRGRVQLPIEHPHVSDARTMNHTHNILHPAAIFMCFKFSFFFFLSTLTVRLSLPLVGTFLQKGRFASLHDFVTTMRRTTPHCTSVHTYGTLCALLFRLCCRGKHIYKLRSLSWRETSHTHPVNIYLGTSAMSDVSATEMVSVHTSDKSTASYDESAGSRKPDDNSVILGAGGPEHVLLSIEVNESSRRTFGQLSHDRQTVPG